MNKQSALYARIFDMLCIMHSIILTSSIVKTLYVPYGLILKSRSIVLFILQSEGLRLWVCEMYKWYKAVLQSV